jgi:hypothetical protein
MITIYNSNLDFDLNSSNSITLSSTSNMVFKTNGIDKMSIVNNGISVSGNVVVSGLITSTGAGFSGIGANLTNIPISAINELRLELNGGTTELSVTRDTLNATIVSEARFGSNYTNRINNELNTRVDNTSNYVLATSNILIGRIINTSNYVDSTSNFLSGRLDNTSNYVFATSNILIGRIINTSNYVDSTSNFLSGRLDNTSNYVFATSNILIGRIINTSNYVDSTSNFLGGRIDNTSNYVFATSNILIGRVINASNYVESTSNILIGRVINASNYVDNTSNFLGGRIDNTSNYVFATSNILIGRIINASNYVDSTSNFLGGRIDNTSNYVFATSNILIGRLINTSNYVDSTSNFLGGRIDNTSNYVFATSNILVGRLINTSNYVESTSNILVAKANFNDSNSSNYVDSTSNILVGRVMNTCNYVLSTSNILVAKANFNDLNASNYVFSTSNFISKRITDLTTDMIYEDQSATKKFIVNNRYNNNLLVNGNLTINSNLIVLGESTTLETIVYTTERMEIVNANNTSTALMIQQKDNFRDILVASNLTTNAFNVANNGDVNIIGNYKKNNRDVINDTSNYVNSTSNILIGRVVHTSNYVSSYKPATAVRADTADKFTTSRRIANIPFDGSADINISYSDLNNQLSFGNGLTTSYDNTTKITSVSATTETPTSANLISIFNTTDFVDNTETSKIELSNNTSNYVRATSNILIGRIRNTSNYIDSINTSLTAAIVSGGQWTSSNTNIYYNKGNVGVGTFNPSNNLHIYSSNNTGANANLAIQEWNSSNYVSSYVNDIITTPAVSSSIITGTMYKYTMFTYTSDTQGLTGQTEYLVSIPENFVCDILMIGGGGKGGYGGGGGGGAGACIIAIEQTLSAGNYYFRVGKGGSGYTNTSVADAGYNTNISDITDTLVYSAVGGGGGGAFRASSANTNTGSNGGCGGGAGACAPSGSFNALLGGLPVNNNVVNRISAAPGINTEFNYAVLGNQGGGDLRTTGSASDARDGAGGGGIGLKGTDHTNTSTDGASGGIGAYQVSINGNPYNFRRDFVNNASFGVRDGLTDNYYIGGGGGGGDTGTGNVGQGGLGGGGIGGNDTTGGNALDNTGGGGGGSGGAGGTAAGGNGGSGLIVLKYKRLYEGKPEIQLIIGNSISSGYNNYKIGNYNGEFQVKSSISSIDTTAITIRNSGNVGIGTTDTSTFKLNVGGTLNTTGLFINGSVFTGSKWTSSSTNIYYNGGNVGIGTTSPLSLLELNSTNYTGALLTLDAGISSSTTQMARSIGRPLLKLGKTSFSTTAGDYYGIGFGFTPALTDNSCTEIGTIITNTSGNETGDLVFSTRPGTNNAAATERMRITSAGNVGIGTNNPSSILQVGGGGRLRIANDNTDNTLIGASDANSATNPRIIISGITRSGNQGNIEYLSTTTGMHAFYTTDSTTERMRIASNGNVGIGTSDTATYKLNVSGSLNATSLFVEGAAFTGSSQWVGTTNIYNTTGNVGIGTADTSTYKLNVNGNINITGNASVNGTLDTTGNVRFLSKYPSLYYEIGDYKFHIFTLGSYIINIPESVICDILMIGGGGGGGVVDSGGGGAGACIVALNQSLAAGNYTINVGSGGVGGILSSTGTITRQGANGGNTTIVNSSSAEIYRAVGGGKAGGLESSGTQSEYTGKSGGCGGGGGFWQGNSGVSGGAVSALNIVNGISSISPSVTTTYGVFGNAGGNTAYWANSYVNANAGGGGGIGVAGSNGVATRSGTGGDGLAQVTINSILINFKTYFAPDWNGFGVLSSSLLYIGGGGGGGGYANAGAGAVIAGGLGGGGIGDQAGANSVFTDAPGNGVPNTGSGGGGASGNAGASGGAGGSGLVIIRYNKNKTIYTDTISGNVNYGGNVNRYYNIGNYGGEFKIISSDNNVDSDYVRITTTGAIFNPTGTSSWTTTSDRRIKENIEDASYDKCYDNINSLGLYRFNYVEGFNNVNKDIKQLGFIAQEVKDIFPKAVSSYNFNNNDINIPDMLTIDITQINYSLYGAVKKLIVMNEDKENRIKRLMELDEDKEYRIKKLEMILNTSNISSL